MTVYVDDMYMYDMGKFGRMKMSHMIADTHEELVSMARSIGVAEKWIQQRGTHQEHFDISMSRRMLAVRNGAVEISMHELAEKCRQRRTSAPKPTLPSNSA